MQNIEKTPLWEFLHAKCKRHFSIFNFCINICSFVNNPFNMSTYPHKVELVDTCSYVNDLKCWNNLNINEFQPKDIDDMMQCVRCNILICTKIKNIEKTNLSLWNEKKIQMSLIPNLNSNTLNWNPIQLNLI